MTLSFQDARVEADYRGATLAGLRQHGRVATCVGLVVYLLFGWLDTYHVAEAVRHEIWNVRLLTCVGALLMFAFSWHPAYRRWGPLALVVVGWAAGVSVIGIFWLLPPDALEPYFAGLVLVTFFTYNFVGTRFIYALAANLSLLVAYNLLFVWLRQVPEQQWLSHNFHLLSANILGGAAAYLAEFRSRRLYLVERDLTRDRQQLRHTALHDALTGLPNRVLLLDRIEQALTQARRTGVGGVVLFLDLNGFKAVNDTHGHAVGDLVLREAAQRLRQCLRESDTLARLGGDEFVLLSLGVTTPEQLQAVSDKLRQAMELPFRLEPQGDGVVFLVHLSASIGSCFFPYEGVGAEELIRRSDEAMYRAKRAGRAGR